MQSVVSLVLLTFVSLALTCASSENRRGNSQQGWRGGPPPPPSSALQLPIPIVDGAVAASGPGTSENEPDLKYFWDAQEQPQVQRLLMDRLVALLQGRPITGSTNGGGSNNNLYERLEGEDLVMPNKRQIRYHQCYFNPISCFRRRK